MKQFYLSLVFENGSHIDYGVVSKTNLDKIMEDRSAAIAKQPLGALKYFFRIRATQS